VQRGIVLPELESGRFEMGHRRRDIVCFVDGRAVHIEVKASGDQGFSGLGVNDIAADYLICLQFGRAFRDDGPELIEVWTLAQPGRFFPKPGKLYLKRLAPDVRSAIVSHRFDLGALLRSDGQEPCDRCARLVRPDGLSTRVLCPNCEEAEKYGRIILDIADGKLGVQRDENGEIIVPWETEGSSN
jgi:hypothetical protein